MRLKKNETIQTMFNLASGILAMLVNLCITFFLSGFIVENLGEEANGFTQLANNFVTYASLLTVAFNSMAGRFMSIYYHQGKHGQVKSYYSTVLICNFVLVAVLAPIAFYVIQNLDSLLVIENADVTDVKILFTCVFFNLFVNLFVSAASLSMFVTNTLYYQNLLNLMRYVLNGALLLIAFSFLPARIYYVSLAAFLLTAASVPVINGIKRHVMPKLKFSHRDFQPQAVKEMFSSGIWNTVNQCGNMLMTGLDLLLCNLFISPSAMGLLSVAKTVPNAIFNMAGILNTNFAPSVTINWARGDQTQLLKELRASMKVSSVMLSISIITFLSFGVEFYMLWMPSLDAKTLTMLSFLTCMAFIPWAGPQALYNVFTAANRLKVNSIAFTATGVLNIFVVYAALKFTDLGVVAIAGTSSALTIIRNLAVTAPYIAKLLGLKWYEFYKDVWISMGCCLINFAAAALVKQIYVPKNYIGLFMAVAMTCLISILADFYFILNKEEQNVIIRKIRRMLHRE